MNRFLSIILLAAVLLASLSASAAVSRNVTIPSWVNASTTTKIPESITYIEEEAFYGDKKMVDVYIPESVTRVGANAFAGCTGINRLVILSRNATLDRNALGTPDETKEIWAPSGSTAQAYAKAYGYTFNALAIDATDLLNYANSLLGIPYDKGPTKTKLQKGSNGQYLHLDCVFFVYACYYDVFGIKLPQSCATMQSLTSQSVFRNQNLTAVKITDPMQLMPGDIICWKSEGGSTCTHVGLYVKDVYSNGKKTDGVFINASSSGGKVMTGNMGLNTIGAARPNYYIRNFMHAWRIL